MPRFQSVRGMRDFLQDEAAKLRYVENTAKEIAKLYGFEEIITPIVEYHDLLTAKSGEEIKARIYAFDDLGGRKVALRPEFTASIARLMATSLRNEPKPMRLFSVGTLYRYDEPQFGRYREFWQSNYEIMGSDRPEADVEVLSVTNQLLKKVGLQKYWFKIGHVGILRGLFTEEGLGEENQNNIMQHLDAQRWEEAFETAKRFGISTRGGEVLREIFETKGKDASKVLKPLKKKLRDYPQSSDSIESLQQILTLCEESGVDLKINIESGFARGLEYYTGLIFEVLVPDMGISLGGGGRYNKLVELFGGESTPAVGVAHGLDRIALALDKQNVNPKSSAGTVVVIPIGDESIPRATALASELRENGVSTELEIMGRRVSTSLQHASKRKAKYAVIIGPRELEDGKAMVKHMAKHQEKRVKIEDVFETISKS
ncbi:MAG: histidine--tRNA ligase [Candidatus Bathyarchaeota archaeon]|nr:histidine--tRNA ligase [Candidatus Bathyarchaeota archaeon]